MRCGTTETALFCSIGTMGVFAILEIEANLVEPLLGYKLIILSQVSAIYDGINKLARIRLQVTATFDTAKSLKP